MLGSLLATRYRAHALPPLRPLLGRLAARLRLWSERARQRHQLAELEEAQLRDIGRSRREAIRESRKPFWRP